MIQQLKPLGALEEDPNLVFNTHSRQPTNIWNSSSERRSDVVSWIMWACVQNVGKYTLTHIKISLKKEKKKIPMREDILGLF